MAAAGSEEQERLWNGPAGRAWADSQELVDRLFLRLRDLLTEAVPADASRVLDVGCGTGATTVAIARRLGPAARCVGVDLSEPMVAGARDRAARERVAAAFVRADAATHRFEPATFDAVVSRFGVMFFDDPPRAFANLRRAAAGDGALRFISWRGPDDNPFMTTAERAAAALLDLPVRRSGEPGQFGLAEPAAIRAILAGGGWEAIEVSPVDAECSLPEDELDAYLTRLGPVGRALEGADATTRERVLATVRPAFDRYVAAGEVRFTAACWMVAARAA
ncbi:MAG: class I SAM-dependent methyltransferase [Thermoleophilia bacterium]